MVHISFGSIFSFVEKEKQLEGQKKKISPKFFLRKTPLNIHKKEKKRKENQKKHITKKIRKRNKKEEAKTQEK